MRITVLAVGTRMPDWVAAAVDVYRKRIPRPFQLDIREISPGQRSAHGSAASAMRKEEESLLKHAARADRVVALDERGEQLSTAELANMVRGWQNHSDSVAIMIGGPDGLTDECRRRADVVWSLSRLTLPHGLVRVVLFEQLYRAWTVLQGHPYHRE